MIGDIDELDELEFLGEFDIDVDDVEMIDVIKIDVDEMIDEVCIEEIIIEKEMVQKMVEQECECVVEIECIIEECCVDIEQCCVEIEWECVCIECEVYECQCDGMCFCVYDWGDWLGYQFEEDGLIEDSENFIFKLMDKCLKVNGKM